MFKTIIKRATLLIFLAVIFSFDLTSKENYLASSVAAGNSQSSTVDEFSQLLDKHKATSNNNFLNKFRSIVEQIDYPSTQNKKSNKSKKTNVVIYEFYDFQCGYCKRFKKVIDKTLKNNKNVEIRFIDYPILGDISVMAAKATLAAKKQGGYSKMHDNLIAYKGRLSEEVIFSAAKEVGLDVKKLKLDMQDKSIDNQLAKNIKLGKFIGASGTPYSYIYANKGKSKKISTVRQQIIPGYVDYKNLKALIANIKG